MAVKFVAWQYDIASPVRSFLLQEARTRISTSQKVQIQMSLS